MIGCLVRSVERKMLWAGVFVFLLGAMGAQAEPVVSSFRINNGEPSTMNPAVTLPNVCADATSVTHSYMASESADFTSATWQPYASVPLFTLSDTTGTKTVYFKVKDSADVESAVTSDTVRLGEGGFSILVWGDNNQNQCLVPAPNEDFLALAGGGAHCLGVKSNGSIVAWGNNDEGQCSVPATNNRFVAVSGGSHHSLALKADGSLAAWGSNLNSMGRLVFQSRVPEVNEGFIGIESGSYYNLALKSDGSVVAWGDGAWGQCKIPEPNRDFVALAAGGMHGLGLKSNGTIVTWGNNARGQCVVPEPNTSFVAVAAGGTHSLGLKADGSVVAWGNNSDGQCSVPAPNSHFVGIGAIGLTSLGLKSDGSIVVWGLEATGQYQVPAPNSFFSAIARGENHFLGLTPHGMGNLQVTLTPAAVVSVGGQWRLANETDDLWHNSGETIRVRTTQTLTFKEVYGWVKPQDRTFPVATDAQIEISGDYHRTTWTLSTSCDNDRGNLLISPAGTAFPHETTVTLMVEPKPGYWFDHWTGDVPPGWEHINPLILTMDANKVIGVELASGPLPPAPQIVSFALNNGAASTPNPTVVLSSACGVQADASPAHYLVSESADFTSATWQPYMPLALFHLSETTGTKTVHFKVRNSAGVESAATSDTIALWGEGFPVSAWGNNNQLQCSVPATPQGFWASAGGDAYSVGLRSDGSVVTWGRFLDPLPAPNRDFVAVAGGDLHCVALKSDGSLVAWKMNWGGQSSVPSPNRNFVGVSVGYKHSLGLKSDGSVVAWGENGEGQCSVPLPNRNFVAVAAGDYHSLGLRSDGSVVAWGANGVGEGDVPLPNSGFLAVAAGNAFSLGLKSDGSILAWGADGRGQCQVPLPNRDFVAVAAGHDFSVGLKSDGSILVWGNNDSGQSSVPTPNSGFTSISGAGDHVLALAAQGSLEVSLAPPEAIAAGARWRLTDEAVDIWHDETVYDPVTDTSSTILKARIGFHSLTFDNIEGWIKPADRQVELTPMGTARVVGLYERIYCTLTTTCSSGTVLVSPVGPSFPYGTTVTLTAQPDPGTWFDRWTGDVPAGLERVNPLTLVMDTTRTIGVNLGSGPPPAAPVVTDFSINHGLATTANPTVMLSNTCTAETSGSAVEYLASESADFTSATWRPYVSILLFRLSDAISKKTVYFRVRNSAGVESAVTSDTIVFRGGENSIKAWGSSTTLPSPNADFVALAAGQQHTLALKSDGSVVAWGVNTFKQCNVPAPNRDFMAVVAGYYHSLGLKSDGSIVAWGETKTVPSDNTGFVAIAAGWGYSLGLKADGSIVAWGNSSIVKNIKPVPNTGFVDIVAQEALCLGLKSDGSIVGWGSNMFGQLTVPSPNTDFISIALGEEHSLGLKSDGSIVAWGHGHHDVGQSNVPQSNTDFVSIAAGTYHSLGLKSDGSIVAWGENSSGQCTMPVPNKYCVAIAGGRASSLAMVSPKGSLRVTLTPSEAVTAGARWRLEGESNWHVSGISETYRVGICNLELFDDLPGWYAQPTIQTVTIEPDELTTATGTYIPGQTWPLSVVAENGTVIRSPSKTNYRDGSTVTLTATPADGYRFVNWSGDATSDNPTIQMTMDSTRTLTANFEPIPTLCSLTVFINPVSAGSVVLSPAGGTYELGTTVTLTVIPAQGCQFVNWTGDASGSATSLQLVMDANKTVTANFELFVLCTLTLVTDPPEGGTVSKTPDQAYYDPGTSITVNAVPAEGYEFRGWWDGATTVSTEASFEYSVSAMLVTLTARFKMLSPEPLTPTVSSFSINNGAALTVNPAVTLSNVCVDATSATHSYMASESADFTSASWQPYASVPMFILSPEAGTKTVYFKVKDQAYVESAVTSDTITLGGEGGTVVAWGDNGAYECDVPSPNSAFVAVAGGPFSSLGLKSDGSIVAWGSNHSGQCDVPSPNIGFVAVSAGGDDLNHRYFSLGLKSDGSIVAWGDNSNGQCNAPSPNRDFVAISAGWHHSLGLKSDGSVVAWGGSHEVPSPNSGFVAISAGVSHNLGLKSDGSVVGWGDNSLGQCTVPEPNCDYVAVVAGNYGQSLGLKSDGSIVPWGNIAGLNSPDGPFVSLSLGDSHCLELKSDGSIVAWGSNLNENFVYTGQSHVPTPNSGFVAVAAGGFHSLAIAQEGSLQVTLNPPDAIADGAQWRVTSETAGVWHNSGEVLPLNIGKDYRVEYKVLAGWQEPAPQTVSIEVDQQVSLTGVYQRVPTCSLATSATQGYVVTSPLRPDYPLGTTVTLYAGARQGYRFSNWTGDVPAGQEETNPLILTMDTTKTLMAVFEPAPSGIVRTCGYNAYGQCDVPSPNSDFVAVAGGANHSLGLKSDGSIVVWGNDNNALYNVPPPNGDFVAVAAGWGHSLGLKSNGSIVAWGDNQSGQCSIPLPNADYLSVAAGGSHSLALVRGGTLQVAVSADPPYAGTVSKTPDQDFYEEGTSVTLKAVAAEGYLFRGWVDNASGTTISQEASFIHQLTTSVSLTARFKPIPPGSYTVGVVADPAAGGTLSKSPDLPSYTTGTSVTLSSVAAVGYKFYGWYDGDVRVSTETQYVYWVETENKTFTAKFFVWHPFVVTLTADPAQGGTLSKTPDKGGYELGDKVTLTAIPAEGYQFTGWYDGVTLLSTSTPYEYTVTAAHKSLTGKFVPLGPDAPTGVMAVGNTYRVLVSWNAVEATTPTYVVARALDGTTDTLPVAWAVDGTEFADDTAVPGVTYAYTVTALDALQNESAPSTAVTAAVSPEVFAAANYKVTAKGYSLVRSASNDLTFEPTIAGSNPGTIKIALLKKMPSNAVDNPAKGIYYLLNQGQVSTLAIAGDVKTLAFDVPVYSLETTGAAKSVSAKSVTFLTANEFGSISIAATKDSGSGLYARTFIQTTSAGTTPMSIKVTGAVVEEVGSTNAAPQPIKLLNVASKTYKDAAKAKKTSLGAVGSLPKVVAEISNTPAPQSEATPCSIQGQTLKAVTVSDGPIVADEIWGAIDKVTVAGGNLRAGLIQSSKNVTLIQATAKKVGGALVGGAVGTAGNPTAMVVAAQPAANSKRVAITKVYGQAGVSGYFYAGYDEETGAPTQTGGIGVLQTKTGQVEGAAFLDPALVAKMKVLPEGQPIAINPES